MDFKKYRLLFLTSVAIGALTPLALPGISITIRLGLYMPFFRPSALPLGRFYQLNE
jgi:hypothetical protein